MAAEREAVRVIAKKTGLKIGVVESVLYEHYELVKQRLACGGSVIIPNFGTFFVKVMCNQGMYMHTKKELILLPYVARFCFTITQYCKQRLGKSLIDIVSTQADYKKYGRCSNAFSSSAYIAADDKIDPRDIRNKKAIEMAFKRYNDLPVKKWKSDEV